MSQIIVATEADTGSLKKYSSSGSNVWSLNRTGGFVTVALDAAGNIVAGGARNYGSSWTSLHKYDSSGTEITSGWPIDTADGVTGVDTDSSSGVYVTTSRSGSSSRTLKKYASPGGSVSWEVNIAASMWAVAVDSSDYAIFGGDTASSLTTYRYSSAGSYQWGKNHHDPVYAITTDSSGNIYAAGYRTTFDFVTTRKYTSGGSLTWSKDLHGATIFGIAVDSSGNIYVAGARTGGYTTRKYDSSGTLQWSADHGATVYAIGIDPDDGYVYTAGARTSSVTVRKYDPATGTEITSGWPVDTGNTARALAFAPIPPVTVAAPGLPVSLALGIPYPTAFRAVPGLPVSLGLAAPTISDPPLPPTGDGQPIYHLWISDGLSLFRMAVEGIQCRRRRNDSTWLTLTAPNQTAVMAAWLQARLGAALVVNAGFHYPDGSESAGELLRAYLTEVAHETRFCGTTLTLTARVDAVNETLQSRELAGVTEIGADGGQRYIRCARVNTRLRPGDTVTGGGLSFVANSVEYRISPSGETMTVREAPP